MLLKTQSKSVYTSFVLQEEYWNAVAQKLSSEQAEEWAVELAGLQQGGGHLWLTWSGTVWAANVELYGCVYRGVDMGKGKRIKFKSCKSQLCIMFNCQYQMREGRE